MSQLGEVPGEVLRARRTASLARAAMGLCGLVVVIRDPHLATIPLLALLGLLIIFGTACVQFALPRARWLTLEESLAGLAAVLIIGYGPERVTILALLWLAGVASGVLARGGRVFWVGRGRESRVVAHVRARDPRAARDARARPL